jgi:hypothetical protein
MNRLSGQVMTAVRLAREETRALYPTVTADLITFETPYPGTYLVLQSILPQNYPWSPELEKAQATLAAAAMGSWARIRENFVTPAGDLRAVGMIQSSKDRIAVGVLGFGADIAANFAAAVILLVLHKHGILLAAGPE